MRLKELAHACIRTQQGERELRREGVRTMYRVMGVSAEGEKGKKKKRKQLRRGINAWMRWVGRQGRYGLL